MFIESVSTGSAPQSFQAAPAVDRTAPREIPLTGGLVALVRYNYRPGSGNRELLIAIAIAEMANDDGTVAIDANRLACETDLSAPTVRKYLRIMERERWLLRCDDACVINPAWIAAAGRTITLEPGQVVVSAASLDALHAEIATLKASPAELHSAPASTPDEAPAGVVA
jgi:hypothetical protein